MNNTVLLINKFCPPSKYSNSFELELPFVHSFDTYATSRGGLGPATVLLSRKYSYRELC